MATGGEEDEEAIRRRRRGGVEAREIQLRGGAHSPVDAMAAGRRALAWWHRGGGQRRGGAATSDGAQRRGAGSGAGRHGRCPDPEGIEEWVSEGSGDGKWRRGGVG